MAAARDAVAQLEFEAEVIYWRGPAPFFFAPVPPDAVAEIRRVSRLVTYGWGMIPVAVTIDGVTFTTSLFPKDDGYLLPIKTVVRRKRDITAGDRISIDMTVQAVRR